MTRKVVVDQHIPVSYTIGMKTDYLDLIELAKVEFES